MTKPRQKLMKKIGIVRPHDTASQAAIKMTLAETAARAAVTTTVTFAVGWLLKKTFEKAAEKAALPPQGKIKPSVAANPAPSHYKAPSRRLPTDH